jgi:isoquinoline 1-oxidoreductase beta subunit
MRHVFACPRGDPRGGETLAGAIVKARALSRRDFLITTAVLGGGMAISLSACTGDRRVPPVAGSSELGPWMVLDTEGGVLLRAPIPECGNGAGTFAAMAIAEELECDWTKVRIEAPSLNRDVREKDVFAIMNGTTNVWAGRSTTQGNLRQLQQIGASARERLRQAAATRWRVPVAEVAARDGRLAHAPTKRDAGFGEFAAEAAAVSLAAEPAIKDSSQWKLVGKRQGKLIDRDIVSGQAVYGIDAPVAGKIYGAIMQSPVHGGRLVSHDYEAIRRMPGVLGVVTVDPRALGPRIPELANDRESLAESAVIVIAEHYWQARQALDALPVKWSDGDGARWQDTAQIETAVVAELARDGEKIVLDKGDARRRIARDPRAIEATYLTPYADQAPLEPLNATALYTEEPEKRLEIWHGGASSLTSFRVASEQSGLPFEAVHLHQTLMGGHFGRRNFADDLRLTVEAARRFPGKPVQLIWSREEMMRQGRYRWLTAGRFQASLDAQGMPEALRTRVCCPGYGIAGIDNVAYAHFGLVPHHRIETRDLPLHIRWGSYRAPGYNSYAFMMESFIDECAHAARVDPADYRRRLLARCPDPGWRSCLEEVVARSGWGQPLPRGSGRGIAISNWGNWVSKDPQSGTTVAVVARVDVTPEGVLRVAQLDLAFDCGQVINRDTVVAQLEGGAIFGLNMALNEELHVQAGRIVESNFSDYRLLTLAEIPKIHVHFGGLSGHARFSEVGEPPVGPVGPAVANAIFQATGKRVRSMPFRKHDLRWT